MSGPDVSVVIPAWNAAAWLARAVDSVLAEAAAAVEVIVVDDGSTDGTADVAARYGDRVRCLVTPNGGAAVARNRGLAVAHAPFVLFLDADDRLLPGSLPAWASTARETGADIVFGPFSTERDGVLTPGRGAHDDGGRTILEGWLTGRGTPPCAVLWRRAFLDGIGGWTPVPRNDDGILGIRALLHGAQVALSDDGMGIWVQHGSPDRVSRRRGAGILAAEYEAFRDIERLATDRNRDIRPPLARAYYRMAYEGHAVGAPDLARDALADARRLGLRGHPGPLKHRVLASLLGLPLKMRLAGHGR